MLSSTHIKSSNWLEQSLLWLVMIIVAAMMFLPFVWMVLSSFKPYQENLVAAPHALAETVHAGQL